MNKTTTHSQTPYLSASDYTKISTLVSELNAFIDKSMRLPVAELLTPGDTPLQIDGTVRELLESAEEACKKRKRQSSITGGTPKEVILRCCIKAVVILSLASQLYLLIKITKIDQANCFAWYSPIASLWQSPLQNSYCTILDP